jgi:glycosidase
VIYNVFTEIYSPAGNFDGVTSDLSRIQQLGINTLFIMPVTPVGQPIGSHPAFGSPYCVHDFYGINPNYGTGADFKRLVDTAHGLGMKVVLDEVLNHSAWDNALIQTHPEYYVHTDGNAQNPNSIAVAFTFNDVAQFDYKTPGNGLSAYITTMLTYWLNTYGVDGFRFDTANDPDGPGRMITQTFWTGLRTALEQVNPNVIMFGEEENVDLALAPFELDYGWNLQTALRQATNSGNSTAGLQSTWAAQNSAYPQGMLHASLLQDWDFDEDLTMYGGALQTMDAAVFNATINGVPMIFNGEEVANGSSGPNTHQKIVWNGTQAAAFSAFYTSLLQLRNQNPALQQGTMTWLANTVPAQVASYTRTSGSATFLVLINFGGSSATFTVQSLPAGTWQDVTPTGAPGGRTHTTPTQAVTLQAHDFAVWSRQ